jgi:predicted acetyltransferase
MSKVRQAQTAEEVEAIIELCAKVFSGYFDGVEQWKNQLRLDTGYSPEQSFFVMEEGRIVSNVRVIRKEMLVGEAVAVMGGIGDVVTDPAFRRKHYATACLQEALRFMEERAYHLSALGTGICDFYRRLGWEIAVPRYSVNVNARAASSLPVEGYEIEVFRPEMLPEVMRLFEEENAGRTCAVVRSEAYWRAQMELSMKGQLEGPTGFLKEHPDGFLVMFGSSGKAMGYARTKPPGESWYIQEAAALDWGAARALLGFLGQKAKDSRQIALDAPPDSRLAQVALQEAGADLSVRRNEWMMRIIRFADLLKAMQPALQRRLASSRFRESSGALNIETDIVGRASLRWEKGKIEASEKKLGAGGETIELTVPQGLLVQMVTGYKSGAVAMEALGLARKLDRENVEILDTLFPAGYPFIHDLDRF